MSRFGYPIPRPSTSGDPVLSGNVVNDVAAVLKKHGFPAVESNNDWAGLRSALWQFVYGPGFEQWAQDGVGQCRDWLQVEDYGPFTVADLQLTARAVDLVRRAVTR